MLSRWQQGEAAAAKRMLGDLAALGLVPVRVRVARLRQQGTGSTDDRPVLYYLTVIIIGRRWVHASTRRRPKVMWSREALPPIS